jgi:hypothetical protein
MNEEKRIYVVVAGTVQVPAPRRSVVQPPGRQIAQACHVVSKLRNNNASYWVPPPPEPIKHVLVPFEPMTTVILQARDSAELRHVQALAVKRKLVWAAFYDTNAEAYGPGEVMTAFAVFATKKQIQYVLDYLPLWGA